MEVVTTLKSFLESIQLQQYHEAFLKAGATEQDLPQLVAFSEQELNEFLSVLHLLPFHSIKLKKRLKELNENNFKSTPVARETTVEPMDTSDLPFPSTREFIISHATIYGKKKNRQLTCYEKAINSAALQLALENPLLISKKGGLFDLAKKKLLKDGYRYKRGSSRSKLKESGAELTEPTPEIECQQQQFNQEQQSQDILLKREENAKRLSQKRLEKIKVLQFQVEQALQCRQTTENRLAGGDHYDNITRRSMEADLKHFEETKLRITKEISKLKAQERKHQWYKRRKLERSASQSTDEGFSSQASSCLTEEEHQDAQHKDIRFSAFSVCCPPSQSMQCSYPSSQEYHSDDEDQHYSSSSSSSTTVLSCSRESDVRASSMSDYDR